MSLNAGSDVEKFDSVEKAGFESVSVFRERKRNDYPISLVRESLAGVGVE